MYQNRYGRFTASDPLLESVYLEAPQTFNRYIYTGNNPVNFTDPDGLDYYGDKKGNIHYFAGSGERDGYENITGKAKAITRSGCTKDGSCLERGSVVFFHANSVEVLSEERQVELAKQTQAEGVNGGYSIVPAPDSAR